MSSAPCSTSTGTAMSCRVRHRRARLVAVGVLGQRADETVEVARLEAVRGGGEVEEIGDAEQAHRGAHDRRRVRGDEQRGEATGAAAHHRGARRVDAVVVRERADAGDGVGDVDVAPRVVERVPVRAAVAGGAAVVRAQHRPATGHEPADARLPVDGRLVGGPAVHVDQQRRRASRPPVGGGSQSSPCTVSPSAPGQVIGVGSGRSCASSSAGAPRRRTSRAPVAGSTTASCGAVRPPERMHDDPRAPPVETGVPTLRHVGHAGVAAPVAERHHHQTGRSRLRCA